MDTKPGLDVVVVSYRTPEDLQVFCSSFAQFSNSSLETTIYIVNVHPTYHDEEGIEDVLSSVKDVCETVYISTNDNVGYSGACNLAGSLGSREVISFFNADVKLLDDRALLNSHDALARNPDWGVLGPAQVNEEKMCTHAGIFGTPVKPEHRAWHTPFRPQYQDVKEAVTVAGSAYFTKRTVWDELHECPVYRAQYPNVEGPFLPTPHYYEETWYSYHARAHDHKVMYYGEALIEHRWHKASPIGGHADRKMQRSKGMFMEMCDLHQIEHD